MTRGGRTHRRLSESEISRADLALSISGRAAFRVVCVLVARGHVERVGIEMIRPIGRRAVLG
jgi:hypothetical protein